MFERIKEKLFAGSAPNFHAPCAGKVIPLSEVPDPTFAEEMLGPGLAMLPATGEVLSPVEGKVVSIFPSLHGITLESKEGAELLIHIGLETVKLKGEGFRSHIELGQKVEVGTPLVSFDKAEIEAKGYNTVIPIVLCNSDEISISDIRYEQVEPKEGIAKLRKAN